MEGGDGSRGASGSGEDGVGRMCCVWVCLEAAGEMARLGCLADVGEGGVAKTACRDWGIEEVVGVGLQEAGATFDSLFKWVHSAGGPSYRMTGHMLLRGWSIFGWRRFLWPGYSALWRWPRALF
jgi:hypothetical protein